VKIQIIFGLLVLATQQALAAGGHGDGAVPQMVYWQVFNLIIVIAGIVYFARQPISNYLAENKRKYAEQADQFLKTKKEAEEKYAALKSKLEVLDQGYTQNLNQAQAHAEKLKQQMIADAQETVRRIQQDANEVRRIEVEKAKREIKQQMIIEASQLARQVLTRDISGLDQQKLHDGFIQNIQST
jgi:F-type H+-transporting ATPase subunit b